MSSGRLALFLLFIVILGTGLEAAYVQATTTRMGIGSSLRLTPSFLFLFSLDLLIPLTVALLSRRLFIVYLALDCLQNIILLHYNIFFYNTLTLATIYHSMHGAASLGLDIFGFARWDIIAVFILLFMCKAVAVQLSLVAHTRMPWVWKLRGITAVTCMAVIWCVSALIYGQTGLSALWVEKRGHRTASERRLQQGAREAVRNIGYLATWLGEWRSGTYKDTDLIYAEMRCKDPDAGAEESTDSRTGTAPTTWQGLPVPCGENTVVLIQVESLDFAALNMKVNGHTVLPFINHLAQESLTLKVFAPHKVGSSNSDYEILNRRVADQNVMYYSYITQYPDSAIGLLAKRGYSPTVFHGLSGKLFNLRTAYAAQGFEHFFFKEDLVAAGYAPSKYIMEHILDEDLFGMAAEQLRQSSGPQAQFIITMSSHIPFMEPLPIFKEARGVFARYVSSLRYVDQCLAAFYAQLPEGALLIIWGDHGSDVTYPQGFPANDRHVPFLVHIKGDKGKMEKAGKDSDGNPRLASPRVYTLCELGHFLRRIVERAQPLAR
ncbi:LTA synthase family protein [Desulfovibrio sp. OttesenSCG-928-F20]|nr:LTA synthase family protein [Desulfovibrio sp. OttesenSCG-928-F20]